LRSYSSYIGGKYVEGQEWIYCLRASALLRDVFANLTLKRDLEQGKRDDAADHDSVVARCAVAGEHELQAALEAAAAAAPVWAAFPLDARFRLAERFHEEARKRRADLVEVLVEEGHPRTLAEWEVAGVLQASHPLTSAWCREQMQREFEQPGRKLRLVRKPDGVVVLSPPLNASLVSSLLGVPVIAGGNALVVKAPRTAPYGTMWAWEEIVRPLLDEVGAPPGVANVVCGHPKKVLDHWMESPLVDDIFFFGSSEVGIPLGVEATRRGKKPILELAGNDAVVVWRDADLDRAAEAITECFFGSGQICMIPNHVVVHPAVAEPLLDRVVSLASKIRPGYPEEQEVLLSPVFKSDLYFEYLEQGVAAGAQLLCGGRRLEIDGTPSGTGLFIEPTVLRVDGLADSRKVLAVARETFFPLIPVVVAEPHESDAELLESVIAFLNSNEYSLRNSVWTGCPELVEQFATRVTNGGLLKINDSHIGLVPYLATHGGGGLTGGPFGEANYPMLRTTHLQGISIGTDIQPRRAVFEQ
jgi:acyl-CoA reductase-like NAD-dependent aldehyde dehydrogenase